MNRKRFLTLSLLPLLGPVLGEPQDDSRIVALQKRWSQCRPTYTGSPYEVPASFTAPFAPGKLAEGFVRDGIQMVNFLRFLAGLPDDVVTDDALMAQAQYGALLMAALGRITHSPSKPAGMSDDLYQKGLKSARSSNLGQGYESIAASVRSYMDDSDNGNIDRLGHRRWILNPPLKKMGFGFVAKGKNDTFTAAQIFDDSRTEPVKYDFIAWPVAGAFPVEFFAPEQAWSLTVNPDRYAPPSAKDVTLRIRRLGTDNGSPQEWRFGADAPLEEGSYFHVDTQGFGVDNCLIFRPSGIKAYTPGERYEVTVNGLRTKDGKPTTLRYITAFFRLESP